MAGIWDRIVPTSEDRLAVHLLTAAVYLAARDVFSDAVLLEKLNEQINEPLDTAAQQDLLAMKTGATTGNAATRIDYLLRVESLGVAVEAGALTSEATYRSELDL